MHNYIWYFQPLSIEKLKPVRLFCKLFNKYDWIWNILPKLRNGFKKIVILISKIIIRCFINYIIILIFNVSWSPFGSSQKNRSFPLLLSLVYESGLQTKRFDRVSIPFKSGSEKNRISSLVTHLISVPLESGSEKHGLVLISGHPVCAPFESRSEKNGFVNSRSFEERSWNFDLFFSIFWAGCSQKHVSFSNQESSQLSQLLDIFVKLIS